MEELMEYLNEEEIEYIRQNEELIEKICNIERIITMNHLLNL